LPDPHPPSPRRAPRDPRAALHRDLLAEAREAACAAPPEHRERLLAEVAAARGRHLSPADGMAAAAELADPSWQAWAFAVLARGAPGAAQARRARAQLRRATEALCAAGAPGTGGEAPGLRAVVEALVEGGDVALAERLCVRTPLDGPAVDALVGGLLDAGRRGRALRLALRLPVSGVRDEALEAVADALAGHGEGEAALAAVDGIADAFERERVRHGVLLELCGCDVDARGAVAVRGVRGALSALHACHAFLLQCLRAGDAEGARAFATAAARIAAAAVDGEHRPRALKLASWLQADVDDVDGALATARALPAGESRRAATEYALWRLVPEPGEAPVPVRALLARAGDAEEREIAACVVARAQVERGDLAGARRWLRRVRSPALRSAVLQGLGAALLEWHGDAAGARRALCHVLPEMRDDMTFRDLAIAQLRDGDPAGAAATLVELRRGGEWAAWSLAGLAARCGQADRLRAWARAHLGPALRAQALLGALAHLDDPPPYDDPAARVFPEAG
jgi:hypothetical protein